MLKKLIPAGLLAAAISLGGCVEREVVHVPPPPPRVVFVPQAPPSEIYEEQPPPPDNRPIWSWQRGHWKWNGTQYVWNHGHWVERPPRYARWVAPQWIQTPQGWRFEEGHWAE